MEYDVVVVGRGPGGLSTAIRLKQLAAASGREVSVCVLEKGSEPGAHILSGAIMDPRALTELLPDWQSLGAPLTQAVTEDESCSSARPVRARRRRRCCRTASRTTATTSSASATSRAGWRSRRRASASNFPGFAAAEVLYGDSGEVVGVATGTVGVGKDGEPTDQFQLGMELHAKYTVFAEGSRGQLGRELIAKFSLDAGRDPQSYAIGLKELWRADPAKHRPGLVVHTAGWPLASDTYGGSFLYHGDDGTIALGFVVGLDYANPWLSPFEEFQRWKTHPAIRTHLDGARGVGYGARSITAGGLLRCRDGVPRRRAGRLRGRLPQGQPHQGQPRGDQDPACSPPRPHSPRSVTVVRTTNCRPIRLRSSRAGCSTSCSARRTSSSGSRRAAPPRR